LLYCLLVLFLRLTHKAFVLFLFKMVCASVLSDHLFFEGDYCISAIIILMLQIYGTFNTKMSNEAADWRLVTETLYIRTAGLK